MPYRPLPSLLLASLIAVALAPGLAHAEVDDLVRNALDMTQKGQSKQAFDMLAAQEEKRAGDPDFDAVLGIAANEAGEFTRAIFALERVLAVQPDNARARAELGRALFAVGDNKGARALLEQTKAQGVPVEAARTIDQFLKAIDKVEEAGQSSWKGYAELGLGSDTNINSGPGVSSVAVPAFGGLVLALNPGGVKTAASFTNAGLGASGRYVLDPRWSLIGNASTGWRGNSGGNSAFNTTQTDLGAGASYRVERNDYSLVAQYSSYGVGGSTARNSTGLVGEWTYRFDGYRQITSYAQWSALSYPSQSVRDANRTVLGGTYAHLFQNGFLAFGGLYIGSEKEKAAGVPHLGHKFSGIRAGVQKPINQDLAWFATLGYESRNFGGADPLFLVTRQDRQTNLNIGLSWSPAPAWRVTPQIGMTRSNSNIAINDYSKRVISVTARREF